MDKIKPTLAEIKESLKRIEETLSPDVLWESSQYLYLYAHLQNIGLEIDTIGVRYEENGMPYLAISFKKPITEIHFDANGEELPNAFLEAVCRLNLLSLKDQNLISERVAKLDLKSE